MARKTSKRPVSTARRNKFQPHDLLLAGIGAVSLGRKQAADFYANGFEGVAVLGELAGDAVQSAARSVGKKVSALRKQAKAKTAPARKQMLAFANEAKAQARQRLAPVLSRLGVTKTPARRTPARKKAKAVRSRRAA